MSDLERIIEEIDPSDLLQTLDPSRPYSGQPHTDLGTRGRTVVEGLTFRDLRDCFVMACFHASGLPAEEYPRSLYNLPWDHMDPLAVFQNMACEIERRMGIYPNVPPLEPHP